MSGRDQQSPIQDIKAAQEGASGLRVWLLLLLLIYGAGLTQTMSEPWVGMHDWNGAFFSQLARNLLRYPISVHHGMPIVAVGSEVPPVEERSTYATHPPGLVWLVAGAFAVFGESESVARMVPILSSLATLGLLVWVVFHAYGRGVAVVSGAIYGLMPMSVYFGRMVNHEPVCLLCMIAATAAWMQILNTGVSKKRVVAWTACTAALVAGVWVDWSVVLFAGVFCVHVVWTYFQKQIGKKVLLTVFGIVGLATASMMAFLVFAGLEGQWEDLVSIFLSRAGQSGGGPIRKDVTSPGGVGTYAVENLTWPVAVLATIGLAASVFSFFIRRNMQGPAGGSIGLGQTEQQPISRYAARAGLGLILITGVVWLLVFWRQYERHNYWMYYLGPAAAVFSARTVMALWERLSHINRSLGYAVAGLVVMTIMAVGYSGTQDYFDRISRSYPPEVVADWKTIHQRTTPHERVLLFRNPILVEERGGYRFRNLVPPQLAYYLDRSIDVEQDFFKVTTRRETHSVFVISKAEAVIHHEKLASLRQEFPEDPLRLLVVFELKRSMQTERRRSRP